MSPQQGCPLWLLMAWVLCLGMLVSEPGEGDQFCLSLAETTAPLNVLLFLSVVHAAQPSILCLDLYFPGSSQIMREVPDEAMILYV